MYNNTSADPYATGDYSLDHGPQIGRFIDATAKKLRTWSSRHRQRRALMNADQRILEDIGISFEDMLRETRKHFWQA